MSTTQRDGEPAVLPARVADILDDPTYGHLLKIDAGGVALHCHFFTSEEIELDVDPKEVDSQARLDALVDFIRGLGTALSKNVILTEENSPEYVWLEYRSDSGQISLTRTA